MDNFKKKSVKKLSLRNDFEELDHRLACGWYVDIEGRGQRKKYLKNVTKTRKQKPLDSLGQKEI